MNEGFKKCIIMINDDCETVCTSSGSLRQMAEEPLRSKSNYVNRLIQRNFGTSRRQRNSIYHRNRQPRDLRCLFVDFCTASRGTKFDDLCVEAADRFCHILLSYQECSID